MTGASEDRKPNPGEEKLVREKFLAKAKRTLGRVPFLEEAAAAYYCAVDPGTPRHVKAVLLGALAYFIVPVDTIPDIIAMFGYSDDAAVFWLAWRIVSAHVTNDHMTRARALVAKLRDEA
jgi:uncharacterized membrane protein YkvA (DUF1232 family)